MKSTKKNKVQQDKNYLIPNYRTELITNSYNTFNIINNSDLIVPQNNFYQTTKTFKIPSRYNSNNFLPSQINPIYSPKRKPKNPIFFKKVSNEAYNQYNQPPIIKKNLTFIKTNQILVQNNNVIFNQIRLTKKDKIIIKPNQEYPIDNYNKKHLNPGDIRRNEAKIGPPPIPINSVDKTKKSICKISYYFNNATTFGTGFFLKYSDSLKLLITNYHVIYPALINNNIQIETWNNEKNILNLKGRYIKFLEPPKDITAIEIKSSDSIYDYIQFLNYDLNYQINGYNRYNNASIFSIEHPLGQDAAAASGKIINIYDFQFDHDISTDNGSSGSPIILLNFNDVIGIHKNTSQKVNGGTFIGEIINAINSDFILGKINDNKNTNEDTISNKKIKVDKDLNLIKHKNIIKNNGNNDNYIIGEINIKDEDVNKKIRLINSYEEARRNNRNIIFYKQLKNEENIKECEIEINNELISFNYFYEFKKKGTYIIKYKFKNYLTDVNHMFYECNSLINLNFSNFNTQKVTNMEWMFYSCNSLTNLNFSNFNTHNVTNMTVMFCNCNSLTNLNLSNFNTQNVTDMGFMFSDCESLTNLNLSNFNTQNVTDMSCMFQECKSLTNLNLSNFNTQNVTGMNRMFKGCKSLINLNLSNFNTQKVTNVEWMFDGCELLFILNLSNFNTQNVTNMEGMFFNCKSLTNLNLSNFNAQNVDIMERMFDGCKSLKKRNVITKEQKIIEQLKNDGIM